MISNFYKMLYKYKGKKWSLLVYRSIKLFLNIFYPFYCRLVKSHKHKNNADGVIVSLTSFPARVDKLWIVIETLLRQTYKPERIILWLADTQFDSIESLPSSLRKLLNRGLEIRFCDDIRSHKKYYYTMKNYPNHTVITVDDDTFYPEDLVENLLRTSEKFPNTICCNLGHRITKEDNGDIKPYVDWESGADGCDIPSYYLVPVGCEGVLYPPGSLNQNVFDKQQISQLCPLADDLWLKSMATLNGIKAVKVHSVSITYANLHSAKVNSLNVINVNQRKNDEQLQKIIFAYPKLKEKWG